MAAPVGPTWFPGVWCDVASHPDGYAFAYAANGNSRLVVRVGSLADASPPIVWQLDLPEPILFLRIAVDGAGEVRGLATAQSDQAMYITSAGTSYLGAAITNRATILKYESGDWVAYICRSAFTYTRWPLAGADPGPFANPFTVSGSSQGMLDVVSGTLRWANFESGGEAGAFYSEVIQGVTLLLATTQGGVTVGAATGPPNNPDSLLAARDGNATVQRVVPVLSSEPYVAPFGNGDTAWAICSRTITVGGMNAALVLAPPWSGTILASGAPDPGGGAGTPTSNRFRKVTRPALPRTSAPRTYPHVDQITVKGVATDPAASVPPQVRDALAASQMTTRLLWDRMGAINESITAATTRLSANADTVAQLERRIVQANDTAREALAVAGKVTAKDPPTSSGPTLPPGQVGGPPTAPPPTEAPPGTVDAIDVTTVNWVGLDVSAWPITAAITSVSITAAQICLDYTGKNTWPAVDPDGSGTLSPGNPWVLAFIGGQWYASTYEWLRVGQICKNVTAVELKDYVTGTSPLDTWTPALGEQVGFMVTSLARQGPQSPVSQRTQIVLTTWPY